MTITQLSELGKCQFCGGEANAESAACDFCHEAWVEYERNAHEQHEAMLRTRRWIASGGIDDGE